MKRSVNIFLFLILFLQGFSQQVVINLTAWTTGQTTLHDSLNMRYYGFGPGFLAPPEFPGPVLETNEGDSVLVEFRNQSQGAGHTIHWHGLDVDQANDGVPQTSFTVNHLQDCTYSFIAPHAGTYLYHCHVASIVHVNMGMYGVFIVHPADGSKKAWTNGPSYHKSYNWLISETDKSWHDTIPVHSTGDSVHKVFSVPEYNPDYFFLNGNSSPSITDSSNSVNGKKGMNIYMRLSNVGFLMNELRFPPGLKPLLISSDGRQLPIQTDTTVVRIAPGERYGLMLRPDTDVDSVISIEYLDMNNMQSRGNKNVRVKIEGVVGNEKPAAIPELTLFPNPTRSRVRILNPGKLEIRGAEVRDLTGKLVRRKNGKLSELDLSLLPDGIYSVLIFTNQGISTHKISLIH